MIPFVSKDIVALLPERADPLAYALVLRGLQSAGPWRRAADIGRHTARDISIDLTREILQDLVRAGLVFENPHESESGYALVKLYEQGITNHVRSTKGLLARDDLSRLEKVESPGLSWQYAYEIEVPEDIRRNLAYIDRSQERALSVVRKEMGLPHDSEPTSGIIHLSSDSLRFTAGATHLDDVKGDILQVQCLYHDGNAHPVLTALPTDTGFAWRLVLPYARRDGPRQSDFTLEELFEMTQAYQLIAQSLDITI